VQAQIATANDLAGDMPAALRSSHRDTCRQGPELAAVGTKNATSVSESEGGVRMEMPNILPRVSVADEKELIEPASSARRMEFEGLLSHYLPRFRRMAMRWLRNPEDAEDAVQDALLSAFKHVARFEGRAQMSSWLTAIVINAARMQLRRRPRHMILSLDQSLGRGPSAIADLLADPKPTPEQALEQRELRELVIKLTAGLPPSQRAAMRLRQRDEFSTKEAAEALGVPKGTLKARLARGRAEVKQQVRKLMDSTSVAGSKARRKRSSGSHCRHGIGQGAVPLAIKSFDQTAQAA
jgi:RNA polymerase sigma-70 factor, ECF subfamily